jgi:hypothetical protein
MDSNFGKVVFPSTEQNGALKMFFEDSSSLPYGAILSGQESPLDFLVAEEGGS